MCGPGAAFRSIYEYPVYYFLCNIQGIFAIMDADGNIRHENLNIHTKDSGRMRDSV